ncbi:MAG: DUF433 domain-containing protein [Anaerolineales bacterium]|nr:DUF433 domain-containing protein [Anaerolineales bacterium]
MQLENYFEFLDENDIRLKGTRVGIETVLDDYLTGSSPEEIAARYLSLSLEQVYATVTYYLHNRAKIDAYLEGWRQYLEESEKEYNRNPPELALHLKERIKNYQQTVLVAERRADYHPELPE